MPKKTVVVPFASDVERRGYLADVEARNRAVAVLANSAGEIAARVGAPPGAFVEVTAGGLSVSWDVPDEASPTTPD